MHEIDRIDVRMLTYRQLCEWFALYTNLGFDSRAGMCIVFEMNMTAPEADTGALLYKAAQKCLSMFVSLTRDTTHPILGSTASDRAKRCAAGPDCKR